MLTITNGDPFVWDRIVQRIPEREVVRQGHEYNYVWTRLSVAHGSWDAFERRHQIGVNFESEQLSGVRDWTRSCLDSQHHHFNSTILRVVLSCPDSSRMKYTPEAMRTPAVL